MTSDILEKNIGWRNMVIKIAIIEDSKEYRNILTSYLSQYEIERQTPIIPRLFESGDQFLSEYENDYDIILMDIDMPGINGMDTAKQIRAQGSNVVIMFITNLAQYAIKGYEVDAIDFVLKPIQYYNFANKIDRAVQIAESREAKIIMLQISSGVVKINARDIYYVEIRDHLLYYHTTKKTYEVRGSLKNSEKMLPKGLFARCSNWCLVGLIHVEEIKDNDIIIQGTALPISRRYKKPFMSAFITYMGRS